VDKGYDAVCLCLAEWVEWLDEQSCLDVRYMPSKSREKSIVILADQSVGVENQIWNLLIEPEILLLTGP